SPAPTGPDPEPAPVEPRPATPWAAILLNVSLLLICTQQAFRAGANRFYEYNLPAYLRQVRGVTVAESGLLTSLPLVACIVGGLVGGTLSDFILARTGSRAAGRKGVAVASLAAGALCFVAAYPLPGVWAAVLVLSLGAFLTTFASPCAYALTMDVAGK